MIRLGHGFTEDPAMTSRQHHPASVPSAHDTIDYNRFRAIAAHQRRLAIAHFSRAARRFLTAMFRKLFSTRPAFRANPGAWHSTSRSAASAPLKPSTPL
jgi:hypothetical protein